MREPRLDVGAVRLDVPGVVDGPGECGAIALSVTANLVWPPTSDMSIYDCAFPDAWDADNAQIPFLNRLSAATALGFGPLNALVSS